MSAVTQEICDTNKKLSNRVKEFIDNVSDVGEESITDFLVWQWKEIDSRFNAIKVSKFTKHQEHMLTGADFEMELWVISDTHATPLLFQAKKILKEHDSYLNKLRYKNNTSSQLQKLQNYSKTTNKVPYYMFYTSAEQIINKCQEPYQDFGIFVMPADTVQQLTTNKANTRLSKSQILSLSTPFHCFFCCPTQRGNYPIMPFKRLFCDRAPSKQATETVERNNLYPNYIKMILNRNFTSSEMQNEISKNELFQTEYIAVYDLRKSNKVNILGYGAFSF